MELYYEFDNYIKRLKTPLTDKNGRLLYYGIYDFSYKFRTRIFDENDNEISYVEKDITAEEPLVNAYAHDGTPLFKLYKEDDEYLVMPQGWRFKTDNSCFMIEHVMMADKKRVVCDDMNIALPLLFALVEIQR